MKMRNNAGNYFLVLDEYFKVVGKRRHSMWLIQYCNTGYTTEVYKSNAEKGKAKDPYEPSSMGMGYTGVFDKNRHPYWKQARRLWSNMIKRCYDPNYESGYYGRGITVDTRWLCFSNFLEDVSSLANFELWLLGLESGKDKYNLDKDLTQEGNKVYTRECCSFVPEGINKADGARRGKPYTKKKRIKVGES